MTDPRIVIDVPWIGPGTNAMYAGQHWRRRKEHADTGHLAALAGMKNKWVIGTVVDVPSGPVALTFTPHHNGRLFDLDGYAYTVKIIIDGFVKAGLFKDDSQKFIRSLTILPTVKSKERFMRVEIAAG